jgi:hypothetical protein
MDTYWTLHHKNIYRLAGLTALILFVIVPLFFFFYKPPTCHDGLQNQDEQGVDCGGACVKVCNASFIPPSVSWTKYDQVADGAYNIAAYIVNQNVAGAVLKAPYKMAVYDRQGQLIAERRNTILIPPRHNVLAFENGIMVNESKPYKVSFEFTAPLEWTPAREADRSLIVVDKQYQADPSGDTLQAVIENNALTDVQNVLIYAVLYDGEGNVTGFSRTTVDVIPHQGNTYAVFTWPPTEQSRSVVTTEIIPIVQPIPLSAHESSVITTPAP